MLNLLALICLSLNAAGIDPKPTINSRIRAAAIIAPRYNPGAAMVSPAVTPTPIGQFKSYREWKAEQLQFWQSRGQSDMVKDLTVADYFAGYLTKQTDQASAIKEVAKRLSSDEVAELMTIYANSVFGSHAAKDSSGPEVPAKEASKQP